MYMGQKTEIYQQCAGGNCEGPAPKEKKQAWKICKNSSDSKGKFSPIVPSDCNPPQI